MGKMGPIETVEFVAGTLVSMSRGHGNGLRIEFDDGREAESDEERMEILSGWLFEAAEEIRSSKGA